MIWLRNSVMRPAYLLRAKVYAMFGSSSEAEKDFEQAIILEPNNAEVWVAKSDFELSLGHTEQASEFYWQGRFLDAGQYPYPGTSLRDFCCLQKILKI